MLEDVKREREREKKWIFAQIQKYIKQKLQQFKKTVFNSARKKKEKKKAVVIERKITHKKWSCNNGKKYQFKSFQSRGSQIMLHHL